MALVKTEVKGGALALVKVECSMAVTCYPLREEGDIQEALLEKEMNSLEELCDYEEKTGIKESYRRPAVLTPCPAGEEKATRRECDLWSW